MTTQSNSTEPETGRVTVQPSGVYTDEPWETVAAFGSEHKTVIKTYDPRVYPERERITVAVVDPCSEVPVEVATANAAYICAAVNSHAELERERDALRDAAREALVIVELHGPIMLHPDNQTKYAGLAARLRAALKESE